MSDRPRVLVVDERDSLLRQCRDALDGEFVVETAPNGMAALHRLGRAGFDVVLADERVRTPDGRTLIAAIRSPEVDVEVVVLERPIAPTALRDTVRRAAHHRRARRDAAEVRRTIESRFGMGAVVGTSPAMQPVFEAITRACADDAPVVLLGERGTGKELAARLIHQCSRRASELFVRVDVREVHAGRVRALLAGEAEGVGGGTLFVEELDDLTENLRQELPALVEAGLPHRIVLVARAGSDAALRIFDDRAHLVELPPLRARSTDIPLLAAHFMAKHAARIAPAVERIAPAAIDALVAHHWPGNVRELEAVIERALVASRGDAIERRHLAPEVLTAAVASSQPAVDPASLSFKEALALARERTSQQYITALLQLCDGNVTRAADLAGLERESLHRLMRKYGIRSELFKPHRGNR